MKLSDLKTALAKVQSLDFLLPSGEQVPAHFHITEVGKVVRQFVDCGGTLRDEEVINIQLWVAGDYDHRLAPAKWLQIIHVAEDQLNLTDVEIEVEYQRDTIGKYRLDFDGLRFLLKNTRTACLAPDQCGIPAPKRRLQLADLQSSSACDPGSGCC